MEYKVKRLLWSKKRNLYIQPGEVVKAEDLGDVKVLEKIGAVEPIEKKSKRAQGPQED